MADRDVRVDQSPDDVESASGGGAAGSGDTGDGHGTEASDKDDLLDGETDAPEPETTADGPPPMEADDGTGLEGLQPGAGGSGGGGGLWDQVGDAYDDAEDAVGEAYDDAEDTVGGDYEDVEKDVADEYNDARVHSNTEHEGGLGDPFDLVFEDPANVNRAANEAYDDVEDAVADTLDDSGLKNAAENVAEELGPPVRSVLNTELGDDVDDQIEDAVGDFERDTRQTLGDAYGEGADVVDDASRSVGDAVDGGFGSGSGDGGAVPGLDDLGRDGEGEPADPLVPVDDVEWDATRRVAEQAGEEGAQDAASDVHDLLDAPGPVSVPGPGEVDGLELD